MATIATSPLALFLRNTPTQNGAYQISSPRDYLHEEEDYDRQYGSEQFPIEQLRAEAGQLVALCQSHRLPAGASVLEIGCGTGRISVGLALQPELGHLLITDPSPAFCGITKRKMDGVAIQAGKVDYGILRAEDVALLPAGAVSLIVLRSVLHHVLDVDGFISGCAKVLPPGGLLVCEEPYYEGYMMMGFLVQFAADALVAAGLSCSEADRERIEYFVAAMQYYCRRDIDKSQGEDKHLFRPDELMVTSRSLNLELTHYPNWRFTSPPEQNRTGRIGYFQRFFNDYIHYCMDWPEDLSSRVALAMKKYFRFFEPVESLDNTAPHCFGTFVFTKR